tara:strand:- start:2123 stop:2842 length:720 start_codon:yes stop_codon:yes gene_type:complete
MDLIEKNLISSGKAKSLYTTEDPDEYIMHFRDDTSAFDGKKIESLQGKGETNNLFNAFVMEKLERASINTHFLKTLSNVDSLVKKLDMLPVECVIRNITAGSICKRLGLNEGETLETPLFEFFYKDDALGDPLINDHHILIFNWANQDQIEEMKRITFEVNEVLKELFLTGDMLLVDFKIEFGMHNNQLILGDEFTPDGCRVWDVETREKLDKDRFRQDLGDVVESYAIIAKRLGLEIS